MFAQLSKTPLASRLSYQARFGLLFWITIAASIHFATVSASDTPELMKGLWDKGEHMAGFGTLALLAALAYPKASLLRLTERLALFGAMIELVQSMPQIHRSCDIYDWFADMLATITVVGLVWLARWRKSGQMRV